jgi:serine phosphatase RsbU (regulator of sigma subunit)/anti-sigma regulatory factor (Ser/Thr protein kinase)
VARTGQPLFHGRGADLLAAHPAVAGASGEALPSGATAVVPVPGLDGPAGVLVLAWPDERELDVNERAAITTLASYAGQALGRVRAVDQRIRTAEQQQAATRDAVLTLQRSLLPDLAVLPRVDLRAVYDAADTDLAAGGDWYDAVRLPDGRLALVVGDVVGHGPAAAAAMAQLRAVGNHLLRTTDDPAHALAALDAAAAREPGTRAATALLAVLDLADDGSGRVDWAGSGHPPPLVVPADGPPRALETGSSAPLGVGGPPPPWRSASLAPGDTLLLITDGLVEQSGADLAAGLRELLTALAGPGAASADAVVDLVRSARNTDDITVLTARLRPSVGPLEVTVDARPEQLRRVRRALAAWLDALDLDDEDVTALELAVGEAAANAVEHAYRDRAPGPVEVRVGLDPTGDCAVVVRDAGTWARPATDPAFRGRGLHLVRSLTDRADVDTAPDGTTVTFARRLRRRPTVPSGGVGRPLPPPHREDAYRSTTTRGATAVVRVHGVVDMATAEQLRTDLLDAGRGGAVPVTVDLDAAAMLGSAGVRVLHELADPLDLHVRARPGTPARTVVDLVGLAHRVLS